MYYCVIIEPGKNHKYVDIDGDFYSEYLFVSQERLNPGDIIMHDKVDWFRIESVNISNMPSFEYSGTMLESRKIIEQYLMGDEET